MRIRLAPLLAAAALAAVGAARAQAGDGSAGPRAPRPGENPLAPIPPEQARSTHGPFQSGACETCHQRHDPLDPGPAVKVTNELCTDCHDEFRGKAPVRMDRSVHPKVAGACTRCHNPHNARKPKLRM